jgi:hypothetical protein
MNAIISFSSVIPRETLILSLLVQICGALLRSRAYRLREGYVLLHFGLAASLAPCFSPRL